MPQQTDNTPRMPADTLAMPRPERSYIAERLLVSLEDDDEMPPHWRAEMDARVQRRESGEKPSHTHEEVMAELDASTTR